VDHYTTTGSTISGATASTGTTEESHPRIGGNIVHKSFEGPNLDALIVFGKSVPGYQNSGYRGALLS